jgi:YHS domain-containing protein
MGHSPAEGGGFTEWNGLHVAYCCAGCATTFEAEPAKFLKEAKEEGTIIAQSIYDPVSRTAVNRKESEFFADFEGVRYFFLTEENMNQFQEEPKSYAKVPKQEVLYCSVMDHGLASYRKAKAYADYDEVRYYFCCPNCQAAFLEDPEQYAEGVEDKVQKPGVANPENPEEDA